MRGLFDSHQPFFAHIVSKKQSKFGGNYHASCYNLDRVLLPIGVLIVQLCNLLLYALAAGCCVAATTAAVVGVCSAQSRVLTFLCTMQLIQGFGGAFVVILLFFSRFLVDYGAVFCSVARPVDRRAPPFAR